MFFDDWTGLADVVRLEPGEHVLKLWIDPYDEVQETNENDNVFEIVSLPRNAVGHFDRIMGDFVNIQSLVSYKENGTIRG